MSQLTTDISCQPSDGGLWPRLKQLSAAALSCNSPGLGWRAANSELWQGRPSPAVWDAPTAWHQNDQRWTQIDHLKDGQPAKIIEIRVSFWPFGSFEKIAVDEVPARVAMTFRGLRSGTSAWESQVRAMSSSVFVPPTRWKAAVFEPSCEWHLLQSWL